MPLPVGCSLSISFLPCDGSQEMLPENERLGVDAPGTFLAQVTNAEDSGCFLVPPLAGVCPVNNRTL